MGKTHQTIAIVPTRLACRMALGVGLGGGEVGEREKESARVTMGRGICYCYF